MCAVPLISHFWQAKAAESDRSQLCKLACESVSVYRAFRYGGATPSFDVLVRLFFFQAATNLIRAAPSRISARVKTPITIIP